MHGNLVRSKFVSCKDALPALASRLSACVKVLESYVVELRDTSVRTIRFNLVDGAWRLSRNVERLIFDIITEEHYRHLIWAVTVVVGRAVLSSSLTINF